MKYKINPCNRRVDTKRNSITYKLSFPFMSTTCRTHKYQNASDETQDTCKRRVDTE